ncbi:hypothetical protein D3C84_461990 [compost metagenome]
MALVLEFVDQVVLAQQDAADLLAVEVGEFADGGQALADQLGFLLGGGLQIA